METHCFGERGFLNLVICFCLPVCLWKKQRFRLDRPGSSGKPIMAPLFLCIYNRAELIIFCWAFHFFYLPSFLLLEFQFPVMETVEFKVDMVGIHEKRLRKCLSKLRGVEKVEVDGNSQKVAVTSYVHRNKILKAIRRGGLKADFWSAQNELLNAYATATATATYGGFFRFNAFF
ncbi:uncharacterized protein LOC111010410 [Momordica charantia]|uniref:Uncharacterized protein LOC111010410 n=1 Tax=Momordica charantia TaxID=3673 RepID=A0A6J1CCX4_MOMCH|nr:uncharacterized protein LOC111010410 [Momordica charantia]